MLVSVPLRIVNHCCSGVRISGSMHMFRLLTYNDDDDNCDNDDDGYGIIIVVVIVVVAVFIVVVFDNDDDIFGVSDVSRIKTSTILWAISH